MTNFSTRSPNLVLVTLLCAAFGALSGTAVGGQPGRLMAQDAESCELHPFTGPRYIKLDRHGAPLAQQQADYNSMPWSCVLDQRTQLVWEIKSRDKGLHHRDNRYTWHNTHAHENGGFAGHPDQGFCQASACDTQAFIAALNRESYCGSKRWRLPNREELRSLIRYDIPYPGPTLERKLFPNTLAQYYWSASPASDDKDSAWGIGFSFGFDYAYFKSHAGYVRAVFSPQTESTKPVSQQALPMQALSATKRAQQAGASESSRPRQ